jgi:hypothetical protein
MRIPVFARRANPSVDRPILRKSESYAKDQIERGRAVWVDPDDPRQGIICREILFFGERRTPLSPKTKKRRRGVLPAIEVGNTRFEQPTTIPSPLIAAISRRFLRMATRNFAEASA